jgi:predicted nucleic acid-binding protein
VADVCVDASFILKLVLPEPEQPQVRVMWGDWLRDRRTIVAPWLWQFETNAVLRRKVAGGEFSEAEGRDAWRLIRRQGVRTVHPRGLFDRAWAIAAELGRRTTYDTVYLATADLHGCEFWTADQRLANAARSRFSWIREI